MHDRLINHPTIPSSTQSVAGVAVSIPSEQELDTLLQACMAGIKANGRDHVSTKMLVTQVLLGFMGIFAGFLYLDPANQCAESACDDQWLAKAIPAEVMRKYMYFLSGFIGFGSTNCTFAYYGPQKYLDMLKTINSPLVKVLATGGVITFVALQGVQIYLAAEGTNASELNLIMSVTGAAPGALFGSAGLVGDLPKFIKRTMSEVKSIYYNCRVQALSVDEKKNLAIDNYYSLARKKFNTLLKAKWQSVVASSANLDITGDENPLLFLLEQNSASQPSTAEIAARTCLRTAAGSILTTSFCSTFLYNTYNVLQPNIENSIGRMAAATALSATTIYSSFALVDKALMGAYDVVKSKLNGQPINSLLFQLRPWHTSAIIGGSATFAFFSYSIADMLWEKMWPSATAGVWSNDLQSAGRGIARAGMDLYHFMGPADVGTQILFRRVLLKGTPKEKFLLRLQLHVEHLTQTMSQTDFIKQITALDHDERALLQITSWDDFLLEVNALDINSAIVKLKEMGLAKHASAILQQATPRVSSTAAHWKSPSYLLGAKSEDSSVLSQSDFMTLSPGDTLGRV